MTSTNHEAGSRSRRARLIKVAWSLALVPLVLALCGAIYQFVSQAWEERSYPAPGRLVDVGGYSLHLYCTGEGEPTVVLDAANQGTVSNWVWIQTELSRHARTCSYDRAGLGWSDLGPASQSAADNARALHALLDGAEVAGPYVLVGHSLGALYTRMFAELYQSEVVGAAFVEGTHPDAFRALGLPDTMPNSPDEGMMDAAPWVSRLGVLRLMGFPQSDPDLPERQHAELAAYLASTKWAYMIKRQYHVFPTLLEEVRPLYDAGSLGDRPVAVVLSGRGDGGVEALREIFAQQAALSSKAMVRRVEEATHVSLVDRRAHAEQTSAAILEVIQATRASPSGG